MPFKIVPLRRYIDDSWHVCDWYVMLIFTLSESEHPIWMRLSKVVFFFLAFWFDPKIPNHQALVSGWRCLPFRIRRLLVSESGVLVYEPGVLVSESDFLVSESGRRPDQLLLLQWWLDCDFTHFSDIGIHTLGCGWKLLDIQYLHNYNILQQLPISPKTLKGLEGFSFEKV